MNFLMVIIIGAVLGALDGVGIFFAPEEPYKWQILIAAMLKGAGWPAYRLFLSPHQPMVVRDRNRGVLRSGLCSRDLSCEGRPEIGRRPIRDSEWDYHGRIDRPLHNHLGGQKNLARRCSRESFPRFCRLDPFHFAHGRRVSYRSKKALSNRAKFAAAALPACKTSS